MLKEEFPDLVVDEGVWKMNDQSSIPRRGIRDYFRLVEFSRLPSNDEVNAVRNWLASNKCPGWTGVTAYKHSMKDGQPIYKFTTTYDSSD